MATIKEVAEQCGVSTATVSYVLNNKEGAVGAKTRERVLQVMREMNYRPSALFRGEAARTTRTIGVVFPHVKRNSLVAHPYTVHVLDGILAVTTERQWHTTLFTVAEWKDIAQDLRTYCDGRVDGLILVGPQAQDGILAALKERGIPTVLINAGNSDPFISSVDVDNIAAAEEAVNYLVSLGHTKIAHLSGDDISENAQERVQGYRKALAKAGLLPLASYIPSGYFTPKSGYERTQVLLDLPLAERPTALFCGNDQIAFGALRALNERQLTNIAVLGFDDDPSAAWSSPPLTTVRQPLQDIGEAAAEQLLALATGGPLRKQLLPTTLIVRDSTPRFITS
jgi:LacI family transcriptional regulator